MRKFCLDKNGDWGFWVTLKDGRKIFIRADRGY